MSRPLRLNARRIGLALILLGAAAVYWLRWEERAEVHLLLGAGLADGENYALAEAISEVVGRYHPRVDILVVPTQGSSQNAELLGSGRLDLDPALIRDVTEVLFGRRFAEKRGQGLRLVSLLDGLHRFQVFGIEELRPVQG